jgi:hypothetical protein
MHLIKRLFASLWKAVSFPFIRLWRIVTGIWRFIATAIVLSLLMYVAVEFISYQRDSHRYSASGNCPVVEQKLAALGASMGRSFRCLNLSPNSTPATQPQGMIFFLASSATPTMENTGHGWVIWARASVDSDGALLVHEFLPVGFGPPSRDTKWPKPVQDFYTAYLASQLPAAIEAPLSKLLGVTWLTLQQSPESPVRFTDTRPLDAVAVTSPQFRSVFGNNPEAAVVALLSDTEYENTKKTISRFGAGDYSLLFRDCTTFVEQVAKEAGLYVPPRLLSPFPSDFISALSITNRK